MITLTPAPKFYQAVQRSVIVVAAAVSLLSCAVLWHYWWQAESVDLQVVEQMPQASLIYDRDGRVLEHFYEENRLLIPGGRVPPSLAAAVIASEDQNFHHHHGVDWTGVFRAAVRNIVPGGSLQGGSTITQQLARNSINRLERTVDRKCLEMFLAWRIERHFSKEQILYHYLNRIYFGRGLHGAETAARAFFGRSTTEIDLHEAALLAGMISAPNAQSPWSNAEAALKARARALRRMLDCGAIGQNEYEAAQGEPLVLRAIPPLIGEFALRDIRVSLAGIVKPGVLMSGGLEVRCTLDSDIQMLAENAVKQLGGEGVAAVVLDARTGAVLALVGGSVYSEDAVNWATRKAPAPPAILTPLWCASLFARQGVSPAARLGPVVAPAVGRPWRIADWMLLEDGQAESVFREALGAEAARFYLELCGVTLPVEWGGETADISLLRMAGLFGVLAGEGHSREPFMVESVRSPGQGWIYQHNPVEKAVFPREIAAQVNRLLLNKTAVFLNGGSSAGDLALRDRVAFYKSAAGGTSHCAVATTSRWVAAVWQTEAAEESGRVAKVTWELAQGVANHLNPGSFAVPASLTTLWLASELPAPMQRWNAVSLMPGQFEDVESAPAMAVEPPAVPQIQKPQKKNFWQRLFGG